MIDSNLLRLYKDRRQYWVASSALRKARELSEQGKKAYSDSWHWARGAGNVTLQSDKEHAWIENTESAGLRFVGFADEIRDSIRHKGWFTDEDGCGEVYRGAVWQLPGRKGVARFISGYADPFNKGAAFVSLSIESDKDADEAKREAAHSADEIARIHAKRERDYQRVASARMRFDEIAGDISNIRNHVMKKIQELRKARAIVGDSFPELCASIRASIRGCLADIASLREERDKLENDFSWSEHWSA